MQQRQLFNDSELKRRIRAALKSELSGAEFWQSFNQSSASPSPIGHGYGVGIDPTAPKAETKKMMEGKNRYKEYINNFEDLHLKSTGSGLSAGELPKKQGRKPKAKANENDNDGELMAVKSVKAVKAVPEKKTKKADTVWMQLVKKQLAIHPGDLKEAIASAKAEYHHM